MRDEFILKRARALWSRSFKFTAGYQPIWSWRRRFEGNELRHLQPSRDQENDRRDLDDGKRKNPCQDHATPPLAERQGGLLSVVSAAPRRAAARAVGTPAARFV